MVAIPVTALVTVLLFSWVNGRAAAPASGGPTPSAAAAPRVPSADASGPVRMGVPPMKPAATAICRALLGRMPATVRDLPRREVSAGPEQNAAYGAPPLTLTCGAAQPTMCATPGDTGCVPLDTELLIMNKVCWYAATEGGTHTFTTMDRQVAVRVTVPVDYEQPGQWANEFSDVVSASDPAKVNDVPSACPPLPR